MRRDKIIIAESGATKTDWCLLCRDEMPVFRKSAGINPFLDSEDGICRSVQEDLADFLADAHGSKVFYYGAGAASRSQAEVVARALSRLVGQQQHVIEGDMLAAARGISGTQPGVVCILGTGSNSCYYDGNKIAEQKASLGFIAGDEGSGNQLGKAGAAVFCLQHI